MQLLIHKDMTKKEMITLVEMIIKALVSKQKELDDDFFDKVDKRNEESYDKMTEDMNDMGDGSSDDVSEKEIIYIRLKNLYAIQKKVIKEENYEVAAEVSKTIKELKKRLNEMLESKSTYTICEPKSVQPKVRDTQ